MGIAPPIQTCGAGRQGESRNRRVIGLIDVCADGSVRDELWPLHWTSEGEEPLPRLPRRGRGRAEALRFLSNPQLRGAGQPRLDLLSRVRQVPLRAVEATGQALSDELWHEHGREPREHCTTRARRLCGRGRRPMEVSELRWNCMRPSRDLHPLRPREEVDRGIVAAVGPSERLRPKCRMRPSDLSDNGG